MSSSRNPPTKTRLRAPERRLTLTPYSGPGGSPPETRDGSATTGPFHSRIPETTSRANSSLVESPDGRGRTTKRSASKFDVLGRRLIHVGHSQEPAPRRNLPLVSDFAVGSQTEDDSQSLLQSSGAPPDRAQGNEQLRSLGR